MTDELLQHFRAALRTLWRTPAFSAAAILVMMLSIGVVAALFSLVNAVWLRPLPYPEPRRLTMVWQENPMRGKHDNLVSARNFLDWREQNDAFQNLAAFRRSNCALADAAGQAQAAEYVAGAQVSADFFAVFGVRPELGRDFSRAEEIEGSDRLALLGHKLWQRRFNADPRVIGTLQNVNGKSLQVVGVMPDGFEFPEATELWMPLGLTEEDLSIRQMRTLYAVGRLREDVSLDTAQQAMAARAAAVESAAALKAGWTVLLRPLHQQVIKNALPALLLLLGAACLVLLIAIANIAMLMLVRADTYQRSLSIRSALGASRGQLIRQLLTESIILSTTAGLFSLLILMAASAKLREFVPASLFRADVDMLDLRVVAFTILLSLVVGAAAVVVPAIKATSAPRALLCLRAGHGQTMGPREKRKANGLVMTQIGVLTVLLILSALITRSFINLTTIEVGFNTDRVLTMALDLSKWPQRQAVANANPAPDEATALVQRMLEQISRLPGVEEAGAVNALPLSGDFFSTNFKINGRAESADEEMTAEVRLCSDRYLQAMQVPLVLGRHFDSGDRNGTANVAIINQTLARQYWPEGSPLGERLAVAVGDEPTEAQIVGIVGDVKDLGLRAAAVPEIYLPLAQQSFSTGRIVVRTAGHPMAAAPSVIRVIQEVAPQQAVFDCQSMDGLLARVTATERVLTQLMLVIAGLAVLLVVVGVYSIMSHAFDRRTREFGIRMAVGATPANILLLTTRQAFRLALFGAIAGVLIAMLTSKTLEHFLFGISTTDPATYAFMAAVSMFTAVLASLHPALRASRTDPITVIRSL